MNLEFPIRILEFPVMNLEFLIRILEFLAMNLEFLIRILEFLIRKFSLPLLLAKVANATLILLAL